MNPPKMPLHIGDYKRDTGHLRAAGHGAYLMLLFHYWSTGGLPTDDEQLSAIACMSRAEWKKMRPVIEPLFKQDWKHARVDFELEKAAKTSEAAREAGKASGRSRSVGNPLNGRSPSVEPTLEPLNHSKKDAANAALPGFEEAPTPPPDTLERQLFDRGKQVLGKDAGGLIAKLLKAKKGDVALARAAIEQASTKQNPREYIGAVITGGHASVDGRRLTNDEQYWGIGRTPGII